MNGLATSRRMRHVTGNAVYTCPFCGQADADDAEHWPLCVALRDCVAAIYSSQAAWRIFNAETCHLQVPLQGTDLQHLCAILHAIWRCRCVIVQGYQFWSGQDMAYHMQTLIEDP